jgi:type II protein arginine methyltransferase
MLGLAANFPTLAEAALDPRQRNDDPTPHLSYMRNLQNKQPPQSQLERFGSGYQDYLQAPLQPLTVNLESITYEVFEKDPVKYDWYEKAIARALHDWIEQGKPTSSPDGRVVVAVVGAGRGPLVTRALRASDDVGVEINIWALEKNPNAFVLLQHHNANPETWANRVQLVKSDMRTWSGPWRPKKMTHPGTIGRDPSSISIGPLTQEIAPGIVEAEHYTIDILISELLGSFAENELSPECLDGVQHLLNPVHGISIPASYTAHLTPIASPKLHADVSTQALSNPNAAETPYVVMLHAIDYLSTTTASLPLTTLNTPTSPTHARTSPLPQPIIQKAWSFAHPNHQLSSPQPTTNSPDPTNSANTLHPITAITNSHNTRHATLSFPIPHRGTIHGLAGYFEAVLYGTVELSTNPLTMDQKSEGMISWFPIYFPLKVSRFHSSTHHLHPAQHEHPPHNIALQSSAQHQSYPFPLTTPSTRH